MKKIFFLSIAIFTFFNFSMAQNKTKPIVKTNTTPFVWEGANLYFLLVDRFNKSEIQPKVYFDISTFKTS